MAPEQRLSALLRRATETLAAAGIEAPRAQALALAGHVTGLDHAGLLARLQEPLAEAARTDFEGLVARRAAHHPLQYLLGEAPFLDFELRVAPGVFIPRPETELLVERALALWDPDCEWAVDVCTGSGAIAIALARARPAARVLAIDISATALRAAAANAHRLGVGDRVFFMRSDLLTATALRGRTDSRLGVLVCNPPYAPYDDVVQPEVRWHEPALAWAGGPVGTEVYATLVPQASRLLAPGRFLLLELGWGQEQTVPGIVAASGCWETPRIDADFQGIPRVLSAQRSRRPVPLEWRHG